MTCKTNVITVTNENLDYINMTVPGKSKQARLEALLAFYKENAFKPRDAGISFGENDRLAPVSGGA
jgi:hypothetical protein